jgi:hypothetical protein
MSRAPIFPTFHELVFNEDNLGRFLCNFYKDGFIVLNKYIIKILCTYILFGKSPLIDRDIVLIIGKLIYNISDPSNIIEYPDYFSQELRCTPGVEKIKDREEPSATVKTQVTEFNRSRTDISNSEEAEDLSPSDEPGSTEDFSYELFRLTPSSPIVEYRVNSLVSYLTLIFNKLCINNLELSEGGKIKISLRFRYEFYDSDDLKFADKSSSPTPSLLYNYFKREEEKIKHLTPDVAESGYFKLLLSRFFKDDYECTPALLDTYSNNYKYSNEKKEEIARRLEESEGILSMLSELEGEEVEESESEPKTELKPGENIAMKKGEKRELNVKLTEATENAADAKLNAAIEELHPKIDVSIELPPIADTAIENIQGSYNAMIEKARKGLLKRAKHKIWKRFGQGFRAINEASIKSVIKLGILTEEELEAYNEELKSINDAKKAEAERKASKKEAAAAEKAAKKKSSSITGGNRRFKKTKKRYILRKIVF